MSNDYNYKFIQLIQSLIFASNSELDSIVYVIQY
ncbi:MAG: hypothetical protein ACI9FN_000762 [Saprospiraceae bacterium]|jgi:hypothetical protein